MKYNVCDNHGHTESPFIPLLLKPSAGRLRDGRGDGRVTPTAKLAQQGCAPLPDQTINRLSLSVFISVYPCQDFVLSFQLPLPAFAFPLSPPWRVLFGETASSSCPAPGRRQRVLFGETASSSCSAPGRRQRVLFGETASSSCSAPGRRQRVLFGETASSSCSAPGRRQRVLFGESASSSCPAPGRRQSVLFPCCFQDVSMQHKKPCNHNSLSMETAGLETPGVSICFHGG